MTTSGTVFGRLNHCAHSGGGARYNSALSPTGPWTKPDIRSMSTTHTCIDVYDVSAYIHGMWWLIGRFDAFRPKGRGFESRSRRHVGTVTILPPPIWLFVSTILPRSVRQHI